MPDKVQANSPSDALILDNEKDARVLRFMKKIKLTKEKSFPAYDDCYGHSDYYSGYKDDDAAYFREVVKQARNDSLLVAEIEKRRDDALETIKSKKKPIPGSIVYAAMKGK